MQKHDPHTGISWGAAARAGWLLALGICLGACSTFRISENPAVNARAFEESPPQTIAVLPFFNASEVDGADTAARLSMISALSRLSYDDVEMERVDSELSELALQHGLAPEELPPPLIHRAAIADAVLSGEVLSVNKLWLPFYSHIKTRMRLSLTDTRTGQVIYQNEARGMSQRLETPFSILGVVTGAFQTLWHLRDDEMVETFERFSQRMVESLPDPVGSALTGQYYIRDARLQIPRDPLRAGDLLQLEFRGTPGQRAFFDLGAIKTNIPMTEIAPGRYGVSYPIEGGQYADYCIVTCKLVAGEHQVRVPLYRQRFGVNARRPAATSIEGFQFLDNSVWLRAAAVRGAGVVAYRFYRSQDPQARFQPIGRSLEPGFEDKTIQPNQTYYYLAMAEDAAGNVSQPPPATSLRVPARGPTTLSGVIRQDTTLQPFSGPYTIAGTLVVAPGVKLTVQPGTALNFGHDARLDVQGALIMTGSATRPVVCRTATGEWMGISLTGAESHVIEHTRIIAARQPVELTGGSLQASNLEVENARIGVFSAPGTQLALRNCRFKGVEQGVDSRSSRTVIDGCYFDRRQVGVAVYSPGATIQRSSFVGEGLAVSNRSGAKLSLDRNYLGAFDPFSLLASYEGPCTFEQLYNKPYPEGSLAQVFPESAAALMNRGRTLAEQGSPQKAAEAYAMALTKELSPELFRHCILQLRASRQLDTALRIGQSAAGMYPHDISILLTHAETLFASGRVDAGRQAVAAAEGKAPDDPRVRELKRKYP